LLRSIPRSIALEDLIGAGRLGLVEAARNYRPEAFGGAPFSSYARPRIRGAIWDSVKRAPFREAKRPRIEDTPEPASYTFTMEAAAAVDRAELGFRMSAALRALPEIQRRVVLLYYEEGLRMRAIGSQFGVTKTGASKIHRAAIRLLRRRLLD
jgi:RNA polymerase sigma factor for flagellar operon FliA